MLESDFVSAVRNNTWCIYFLWGGGDASCPNFSWHILLQMLDLLLEAETLRLMKVGLIFGYN